MLGALSKLFGNHSTNKTANKKPGFDRRRSDRRQCHERREIYRLDGDQIDRRTGEDRRRGHGIWSHERH